MRAMWLASIGIVVQAVVGTVASAAVPQLGTTLVGTGFNQPTFVAQAPGDNANLWVLEKGTGTTASIKLLNLNTHASSTLLTLSNVATASEEGLLGLAFDPNYTTNGDFYIDYTFNGGTAGLTTIAEYHNPGGGETPTLVGNLLQIDQPQQNHKAGWIGFSPRAGDANNLYISTGDGGNANDQGTGHIEPGGNAQNTTTLLGKMLRIHVDPTTATYTIPANNPFASLSDPTVKKEIFLTGLRNPFRDSFDPATGTLYIGDVGQDTREEIDVQTSAGGGENYGWRLREGNIQTPTVGGPPPAGYVPPILDYDHTSGVTTLAGRTVIGGYVYRGAAIPALDGTYIFGDYLGPNNLNETEVFSLTYDGTNVTSVQDLTPMLNPNGTVLTNISSFGVDNAGDIFIVDIGSGEIFEIIAVPEPASAGILVGTMAVVLCRRRRNELH